MKAFKKVKIFGFNFLEAEKGFKIDEVEIKQAKEILKNVGTVINKTTDLINEKKLVKPIFDLIYDLSKKILFWSLIVFTFSILVVLFINTFAAWGAFFLSIFVVLRVLSTISFILGGVLLLIAYAFLRS